MPGLKLIYDSKRGSMWLAPFLIKDTYLSSIVKTMVADDLAIQGARALAVEHWSSYPGFSTNKTLMLNISEKVAYFEKIAYYLIMPMENILF